MDKPKKCVIVGDMCGKTNLIWRFLRGELWHGTGTVFDDYWGDVSIPEIPLQLKINIHDTSGYEDYDRLRPLAYPLTHIFIVCFSVARRSTFENVMAKWVPEIQHHCPDTPFLLVGLQTDRRTDEIALARSIRNKQSAVAQEEGVALAEKIGAVTYLECSAITGEGIEEVFRTAGFTALYGGIGMRNRASTSTLGRLSRRMFPSPKTDDNETVPIPWVLYSGLNNCKYPFTKIDDIHKILCSDTPHPDFKYLRQLYHKEENIPMAFLNEIVENWVVLRKERATVKKFVALIKAEMPDFAANITKLFPSHYKMTSTSWLDDYKMEKCLGMGSFGIVLQGRKPIAGSTNPESRSTKSDVAALKFIFLYNRADFEVVDREISVTKNMKHENLVNHYDYAVHKRFCEADIRNLFASFNSSPENFGFSAQQGIDSVIARAQRQKTVHGTVISMELCGEALRTWLENTDAPQRPASMSICIVVGIISGLTFLHEKLKIIHRDLKPENLLFAGEGYQLPVKIADFGLARVFTPAPGSVSCSLTAEAGSSMYRAPEVNEGHYGNQCDIFSLGLIIWEVFQKIPSQKLKFHFDRLVNDGEIELIQESEFLNNFQELVINLTKKKRKDRTQSVADIQLQVSDLGKEELAKSIATLGGDATKENVEIDQKLGKMSLENENP